MPKLSLGEQVEMLRVQFETALPGPSVLVVSSAQSGDGKSVAALGLAKSMLAAGYATLVVLAEGRGPRQTAVEPGSLREILDAGLERFAWKSLRTGCDAIALGNREIRQSASREAVAEFLGACRRAYDFTIVDAGSVLSNNLSLLLAIAADGVMLTVREGRRVHAADRDVVKTLERERAKFLGVVSISGATIRAAAAAAAPAYASAAKAEIPEFETRRKRQAV
jgi:Mrp family chromosome partitioning ATPase